MAPITNVVGGLQAQGSNLVGAVKTIAEKAKINLINQQTIFTKTTGEKMADVKELAEQLVNLTIKEANELAKYLMKSTALNLQLQL